MSSPWPDSPPAEAALHRLVLAHIDEVVYLVETTPGNPFNGTVKFVSERAENILGYLPAEFIANPDLWRSLVHPDDLPAQGAATAAIYNGKQPGTRLYRLRHRHTGEYRWMEDRVVPQLDREGQLTGIFGVARDVTARQAAAAALAAQKNRLAAIFDNEPECVKIVSSEGRLMEMNPAGLAMLEAASLDEARSQPLAEYLLPEHRAAFARLHQRVMRGESGTLEFEIQGRRGTRRWLETHAAPLRDEAGRAQAVLGITRDITARRQAEIRGAARLERLERLVQSGLQLAGDPAAVFDRAVSLIGELFGVRVVCLSEIHGGELAFKAVWAGGRIERDAGRCPLAITPCASVGQARELRVYDRVQERFPQADFLRKHRAVSYCGFPSLDAEGRVLAVTCLLDDRPREFDEEDRQILRMIGQRIALEVERGHVLAAARQTEARLRQLSRVVEQTADCVLITDREGVIRYVNRAFEEVTGFPAAEVLGRKPSLMKSGRHSAEFYEHLWQTISAGRVFRAVFINRRRDGSIFHEDKTITPIRDLAGQITHFVSTARDISGRLEAERALRESEDSLNRAQAVAKLGSWTLDLRRNVLAWSAETYRIFGILPGTPLDFETFISCVHPEDRDLLNRRWQAALEGVPYDVEHRIIVDGGEKWIHEQAELEFDAEGRPVRAVGTAHDITDRRRLEDQLRQTQKMEAIGQLAGGVAHDFNNMLGAIMMQAELLALKATLPPDARELLVDMRDSIEHATGLTRQLLLFSRRHALQLREMDLNGSVSDLAKMLQRLLGEDVHLQLRLHPAPLVTRADAGMLDQVLLNLAVNARDAMPGGGDLLIETALKDVDAEQAYAHPDAVPGRHACLTVSDTGTGIAPDVLPRIFEPFFTTKDPGQGTGLGLATVFGIVKQHGGWVTVESEPGRGARFQVFLPVAAAAHGAAAPAPVHTPPRGGTEGILLVEDDPAVRQLTRMILDLHGYVVFEAATGAGAVDRWKQEQGRVALLLTDLVMPGGMNGQQLARQLRAEQPDLKVIYASGYSAEIAGRELQLGPGESFVQKPFALHHLLETVRRSLDG